MDIQEYKKSARLREWAEMVRACRSSGKTVSVWCCENGVREKAYYYRQKKVCDAIPGVRQAPVLPDVGHEAAASFAEIQRSGKTKAENPAVTVQVGKAIVQIHNRADAETVETDLRVLSGIC